MVSLHFLVLASKEVFEIMRAIREEVDKPKTMIDMDAFDWKTLASKKLDDFV